MKIRQGLVSNSSSSSFLIVGLKRGDFSTIDKIKFEKYKTYAMVGTDLEYGASPLVLDKETFAKTEGPVTCFSVDRDCNYTDSIKKAREVYLGELGEGC